MTDKPHSDQTPAALSARAWPRRTALCGALGAVLGALGACGRTPSARAVAADLNDPFIVDLQERTFRWFWELTPHDTGLTLDRWPTPAFCSIAAVGFALTAYGVGIERGWISRQQGLSRTLNTLRFFCRAPSGPAASGVSGYKGFFYHFLDSKTGQRFEQVELSSIDTTWLLAGALFAQSYFDGASADEIEVRARADALYARVDWPWMRTRAPFVTMGWHPENGFIHDDWRKYNEAALLYILAIASPSRAIEASAWDAWIASCRDDWTSRWGVEYLHFPALFGHEYSAVWIDFRAVQDAFMREKSIDYFENARRAVLAQQIYATHNPGSWRDYGADMFGLSACDGPGDFKARIDGREREFFSYSARGPGDRDDGTIAPTALGGAVPFAPDITVPALKKMHERYGANLYGQYGFLDAFNPTLREQRHEVSQGRVVDGLAWFGTDYLGIDQGPIVCMIENWRSGLIWNVMRKNEHVRRGLTLAGFTGGWLGR